MESEMVEKMACLMVVSKVESWVEMDLMMVDWREYKLVD